MLPAPRKRRLDFMGYGVCFLVGAAQGFRASFRLPSFGITIQIC